MQVISWFFIFLNKPWRYHLSDIEGKNIKTTAKSTKNYQNPVFLRVDIVLIVA